MYSGIQRIEEVIDNIEANITSDMDYNSMAAKMNLSVYEFRRIFSFIVGCPVSDYVRKRRLSLAAIEIMTADKVDILGISEKYGYSNQSAFTRAFCEQHGVSPTACLHEKMEINLFTRPKFEMSICGRENIPFKIMRMEEFYIQGFSAVSNITDSCCCKNVWNEFYESETDKKLNCDKIYASYQNEKSNVKCTIGEFVSRPEGQMDFVKIPASHWACYKMNTVDDDVVNERYSKILYELLPSAKLKRKDNMPAIEVYPFDMSEEGFEWEIRVPIE